MSRDGDSLSAASEPGHPDPGHSPPTPDRRHDAARAPGAPAVPAGANGLLSAPTFRDPGAVRRNSACCQSARSGWFTPDLIEFAQLMVDEGYSHGISSATFYAWKAKFGGMEPSEAKRLKALEDENGKLKRLLAEAMLDNTALKDLLSKKW